MVTDLHLQDWTDLRVSADPPFRLGWFITSRQSILSTWSHQLVKWIIIKCIEELSFLNILQKTCIGAEFGQFLLFRKTSASVGGSWQAVGNSVGITIDSRFSGAPGLAVPFESLAYSPHRSATAPSTLSWLTEIIVRRINSMVLSLPLKWMDFIPLPLLFNSPLSKALDARNFGRPLSVKVDHHILSNFVAFSIWFAYVSSVHFFSNPGPKNDQCPRMNLRAYSVTLWAFAIQFSLFPHFLHSMS